MDEIGRETPSETSWVDAYLTVNILIADFFKEARVEGFSVDPNPNISLRHHRGKARKLTKIDLSEIRSRATDFRGIYGETGPESEALAVGKIVRGRFGSFFRRTIERVEVTLEKSPALLEAHFSPGELNSREFVLLTAILTRSKVVGLALHKKNKNV